MNAYLIAYALGCFVFPPLHVHGKTFFWAEIFLVPLVLVGAKDFLTGGFRNYPRVLYFVTAACVAAFISGYWRGHQGLDVSIYQQLPINEVTLKTDGFSLSRDGIAFARWLIIFLTPWLARIFFGNNLDARSLPLRFFRLIEGAVALSALLAVADHEHLISLAASGYHDISEYWVGRSFGTGPSPLEGGLTYGMVLVLAVVELWELLIIPAPRDSKAHLRKIGVQSGLMLLCAYALLLTRTATADVAVILAILFSIGAKMKNYKERLILLVLLILGCVGIWEVTPPNFLSAKVSDLAVRSTTWARFASLLPQRPWLLLTGFGFSAASRRRDNSIIPLFSH